jgi:hypothetical protein
MKVGCASPDDQLEKSVDVAQEHIGAFLIQWHFVGESDRVSYSVIKFTSISCPELYSLVGEAGYVREAGGRPLVLNCG